MTIVDDYRRKLDNDLLGAIRLDSYTGSRFIAMPDPTSRRAESTPIIRLPSG